MAIPYTDGDVLVYRAGFATEYPKYTLVLNEDEAMEFQYKKEVNAYVKENGLEHCEVKVDTILEPVQNALSVVDSMLSRVAHYFGVSPLSLNVVLSGQGNFRKDVATVKPYKGSRKPRPVHYDAIREHMAHKYVTHITKDEEADDYLGYVQYSHFYNDGEDSSCIVTIDKDLDMIPGLHYNPITEQEYYVDEDEADRFFLQQLLSGDPTDDIQGVPKIGPKKAETMLEDVPTGGALDMIRNTYIDAYGDNGEAIMDEMAQLLWIRRAPKQNWTNYWGEAWRKST